MTEREFDPVIVWIHIVAGIALIALHPPIVGCTPPMPPEIKVPPPAPLAPATCETACAHARELGCVVGTPTPAGATCEEVCRNVERIGHEEARWPVKCVHESTTCEQADSCQ